MMITLFLFPVITIVIFTVTPSSSLLTLLPPSPPQCSLLPPLELNSLPLFTTLCQNPDSPMSIVLNGVDVTVNMLCDFDCRCIHGATARGGRCQLPSSQNEAPFCRCDYDRVPVREPLLPLIPCPNLINLVGTVRGVPLLGGTLNELVVAPFEQICDLDCRCAHGYWQVDNNIRSEFSTENGDANNQNIYCVCGNAQTLPV